MTLRTPNPLDFSHFLAAPAPLVLELGSSSSFGNSVWDPKVGVPQRDDERSRMGEGNSDTGRAGSRL
jgi:hypothetical protein